jgi:hypothetical protein
LALLWGRDQAQYARALGSLKMSLLFGPNNQLKPSRSGRVLADTSPPPARTCPDPSALLPGCLCSSVWMEVITEIRFISGPLIRTLGRLRVSAGWPSAPQPFPRSHPVALCAYKVHTYEIHAYKVQAYKMHAHEICTCKMHPHKVQAPETHTCEIKAHETRAYEVYPHEMHTCEMHVHEIHIHETPDHHCFSGSLA